MSILSSWESPNKLGLIHLNAKKMNAKKVLLGGLAGGIAYFLLGWLIYGIVLMDYMSDNCNPAMKAMTRPESEMLLGVLFLSNLAWAILIALIISWSKKSSVMEGATIGAIVGSLSAFAIDTSFYAMTTMYPSQMMILVDILGVTIMSIVAGGIIAFVMGMGKEEA